MLDFLRPGLLGVGALLALAPVLLHLIGRRPRDRAPLPTARFLRPDPELTPRLQRRPTEPLLLLLRSLLLLLLGAAAAGPVWSPSRDLPVHLVLLDRAGIGAGGWAAAVDSARTLLLPERGDALGDLLLFDTAAVRVPAARLSRSYFDSLATAGPSRGPVDYAAALRSLPLAARHHPEADSLRVTLVTRSTWAGWSPGLAQIRTAAWPGRIRLVTLPGSDGGTAAPEAEARGQGRAAVIAREGEGRYVSAALRSLGWTVERGGVGDASLVVLLAPRGSDAGGLLERAEAGAVVVVAGEPPTGSLGEALPWRDAAGARTADRESGGALVLADGTALDGAGRRRAGAAAEGAHLLAAWEDGEPAAIAAPQGAGCLVFLGTGLEEGALPLSPDFPTLVERLAGGCRDSESEARDGQPLDRGALAVLERPDRPFAVSAASVVPAGAGRPLGRWVLLIALAVAAVETVLAYRARR